MNLLFAFLVMTISGSAFSFDPQDGNGGNMCILKANSSSDNRPTTIEEALVPVYDADIVLANSNDMNDRACDHLSPDKFGYVDLTATRAGADVLRSIRQIPSYSKLMEANLELFAQEIESLFWLLKRVKLTTDGFLRGAGLGDYELALCKKGSIKAVIVTLANGTTYLSLPNWNQLTLRSRKLIIIHETLRIAQMFRPWFQRFSNEQLYHLSVLLYTRNTRLLSADAFMSFIKYNNARNPLSCSPREDMETSVSELLDRNRADAAFRKTLDLSCHKTPFALTNNILNLKMNPKYRALVDDVGYDWE